MPEQDNRQSVSRLAYEEATHAPLNEWYIAGQGFVTAGDPPASGMPWRLDPETGEEIHAIQRSEPPHTYLSDYRVGSSYPQTTFVFADRPDGEPTSHEYLEDFLRSHGLWSDALSPVVVPKSPGELRPGFMFRPPERAPYNLDSIKDSLRNKFDLDEHAIVGNNRGFQAFVDN